MTEKPDEFLTVNEIAKMMKLNIYTVYGYINSGELKAIKLNGVIRIRPSDLEAFLTARTTRGA